MLVSVPEIPPKNVLHSCIKNTFGHHINTILLIYTLHPKIVDIVIFSNKGIVLTVSDNYGSWLLSNSTLLFLEHNCNSIAWFFFFFEASIAWFLLILIFKFADKLELELFITTRLCI
jgi:hypothetical protein